MVRDPLGWCQIAQAELGFGLDFRRELLGILTD